MSFVVQLVPSVFIFTLMVFMSIGIYLSLPFVILSSWLTFAAEGKWFGWFSRAWWDVRSLHNDVKLMFRSAIN